ncbi:MAG: hypothetical protein MUD14_00340 [Hydrococcus sp. Prado102]|jgi:hypothetical protein|nr:hypothetical protein [Hydrococcus sp. Prado102]
MEKIKLAKWRGLSRSLLFSVSSIAASMAIASSPVLAATLASSQAQFQLDNFSQRPDTTSTFTDIDSFSTVSVRGEVKTSARPSAFFSDAPLENLSALGNSSTLATGKGNNYFGEVQSEADVFGTFAIEEAESFSFDFASFLDLETSIQNTRSESATAVGDISIFLLDSTDSNNVAILDFFFLSGNLSTPDDSSDFLVFDNSNNVTLTNSSQNLSVDGNEEFLSADFQGSFQRFFDRQTRLTLIAIQTDDVSVVARPVSIPESGFDLTLLMFGVASILKRKRSRLV